METEHNSVIFDSTLALYAIDAKGNRKSLFSLVMENRVDIENYIDYQKNEYTFQRGVLKLDNTELVTYDEVVKCNHIIDNEFIIDNDEFDKCIKYLIEELQFNHLSQHFEFPWSPYTKDEVVLDRLNALVLLYENNSHLNLELLYTTKLRKKENL